MKVPRWDYLCDNTEVHGDERVPADTVNVWSPQQGQVVELEVCDNCLASISHAQITTLADEKGREIYAPDAHPELVCPYGCQNYRPFANQAGLSRHLTVKHPEWPGHNQD